MNQHFWSEPFTRSLKKRQFIADIGHFPFGREKKRKFRANCPEVVEHVLRSENSTRLFFFLAQWKAPAIYAIPNVTKSSTWRVLAGRQVARDQHQQWPSCCMS